MTTKVIGILAIACAVTFGTEARASVISYSYAVDASTYDVSGGTATVQVYLKETLTGGSTSLIGPAGLNSGLDGAAFKVTREWGTSVKINDLGFNPLFDNADPQLRIKTVTATLASLNETTLGSSNGVGVDASGLVYLGQVVLVLDTGSGNAGFSIQPSDATTGHLISRLNDGTTLDTTLPGTATFTATVPEPVSLGFLGMGGMLLLRRRIKA